MIITDIQDKLNEAKFFLGRMREDSLKRDDFRYYVSAFLNALYSVQEYLHKIYEKNPAFRVWERQFEDKFNNHSVANYLRAQRNRVTHVRSLKPRGHFNVNIVQEILIMPGTGSALNIKPVNYAFSNESKIEKEVKWYFEDFRHKDVLTMCNEYFNLMADTVNECEGKF